MRTRWPGILIALLAASLVTLAGCQPPGVDVPFETIEQDPNNIGSTLAYPDGESRAILVTMPEEISQIEKFVSQAALEQLDALDFQQYVVIAVFRGRKANGGYPTIIERITLYDDQATIYAQFWNPSKEGPLVIALETSPYHVVKVRRDAGINQDTTLILKSRLVVPTPPRR